MAGGCIHHGTRVETGGGGVYFLKWSPSAHAEMFEREAEGLEALRAAAAGSARVGPRVPEPLALGGGDGAPAWLLMEYVEPGPGGEACDEALGRGLAEMHASASDGPIGWPTDNWIGTLPQANRPSDSWGAFWRDRRLDPQLARARGHGRLTEPAWDRLLEAVPGALDGVGDVGLLHGDLWSGNAFADARGRPVLVDPAVYRGHGEVDVAMSELFGGFGPRFYAAYAETRPLDAGFRALRRPLYQLYYLLVHVNLFGGSYVAAARDAAGRVLAEVG